MSNKDLRVSRREVAIAGAALGALGASASAQDSALPTPTLTYAFEAAVNVGPPQDIGEVGGNIRRVIPVLSGTISGPRLNATVLPGGADWQTILPSGVAHLVARGTMMTDDGTVIGMVNTAIRRVSPEVAERMAAGEIVPASEYYFIGTPRFEVGPGPYSWLGESIFVATGERRPNDVLLRYFVVS